MKRLNAVVIISDNKKGLYRVITLLDLEERSFLCIDRYYLGNATRLALIRLIVEKRYLVRL